MKKKLPYIAIHGKNVQELIEIEMILIMLGYDEPCEEWNNDICGTESDGGGLFSRSKTGAHILCSNHVGYHNHKGHDAKLFEVKNLTEIINYVTNYKG